MNKFQHYADIVTFLALFIFMLYLFWSHTWWTLLFSCMLHSYSVVSCKRTMVQYTVDLVILYVFNDISKVQVLM
jgi:hypothetical protein